MFEFEKLQVKQVINEMKILEMRMTELKNRDLDSYRHIALMYKDLFNTYESLEWIIRDIFGGDKEHTNAFRIQKKIFIENEVKVLNRISISLLKNNDYRNYKYTLQSYRDLLNLRDYIILNISQVNSNNEVLLEELVNVLKNIKMEE